MQATESFDIADAFILQNYRIHSFDFDFDFCFCFCGSRCGLPPSATPTYRQPASLAIAVLADGPYLLTKGEYKNGPAMLGS